MGDTTLHRHRCAGCGTVWKHYQSQLKTEAQYKKAHTCPVCREEQYWKYSGRQRAHRPEEIAKMKLVKS